MIKNKQNAKQKTKKSSLKGELPLNLRLHVCYEVEDVP